MEEKEEREHKPEEAHKEIHKNEKVRERAGENQKEGQKEHKPEEAHKTTQSHSAHTEHTKHHHAAHHKPKSVITPGIIALTILTVLVVVFNQVQIQSVTAMVNTPSRTAHTSGGNLADLDLSQIKSTAQTINVVFDLQGASPDEVMSIMFPTGTPEYGEQLGVNFDDPVESLATLARMLPSLKAEVQKSNPEAFARYVNLASNPYGVACEFCCGIGPAGADKKGNSKCGCQHNPALLSLTLYLTTYTDYNDAEILREVMKWKTLFFPKNMIELGTQIAGGDSSALKSLPGMVGGC